MSPRPPPTPRFPVPRDYFAQQGPALTPAQQQQYCATARERIAAVLAAEREHVETQLRHVNTTHWKLARKKKDVRVYRRRGRADGEHADMDMLGVGRIEGTLEDLIYGMYDRTTDEMQATMAFNGVGTTDCAVLHNLELATPDDPFHYVGLKWALTQLPGKRVVKPRDWCYLEAMGITRNEVTGDRYGYLIVHSVDVPNCPPFDPRAVVRGDGSLAFLYRQVPDASGHHIELFAQGLFHPRGDLHDYVSVLMTTAIVAGQALAVQCAEAKKLTLLAQRNVRKRVGGDNDLNTSSREPVQAACYMCVRRDGVFSTLKVCNVCGVTACDKCRARRVVYTGDQPGSVCDIVSCHSCIFEASRLVVKPADDAFAIHRSVRPVVDSNISTPPKSMAAARRKFSGVTSSMVSSTGTSSRKTSIACTSTVKSTRSNGSVPRSAPVLVLEHSASNDVVDVDTAASNDGDYSSLGETDFEKIIDAMIDERRMGSGRGGGHVASRTASHQLELELDVGSARSRAHMLSQSVVTAPPLASVNSSAIVPAVELAVPAASGPMMTHEDEQAAMFQKMVELQIAASRVFKITQANEVIMKNIG